MGTSVSPWLKAAVNKNNNSNLVTVPPGSVLADVLLETPIFMDEDAMHSGGTGRGLHSFPFPLNLSRV